MKRMNADKERGLVPPILSVLICFICVHLRLKEFRVPRPNIAAVVLAAGLSKRMGAFKPLLPLGGKVLLLHVI